MGVTAVDEGRRLVIGAALVSIDGPWVMTANYAATLVWVVE